jgi:hypothetical protein
VRTSQPPPPERRWSPQWNCIPRLNLPRQKMCVQQSGNEYVLDVKVGLQVLNEACVADRVASIPLMGQARSVQCSGRFMDGICLDGKGWLLGCTPLRITGRVPRNQPQFAGVRMPSSPLACWDSRDARSIKTSNAAVS